MSNMTKRSFPLGIALLLALLLTACGSTQNNLEASTSGVEDPSPVNSVFMTGGPGIDPTAIDVCAELPREKVEAAIGPLTEEPTASIAIGSEVGCDYVVEQGRVYEMTIYNLDRWDLIPQFLDVTPVPDLGDSAYVQHSAVNGGTQLFVLVRDRAVVSASVNGADTPQLRKLLDLAIAEVQ